MDDSRQTWFDEMEHELDEANAELARHHELIVKLRAGLEEVLDDAWKYWELADVDEAPSRLEYYSRLLNREVG